MNHLDTLDRKNVNVLGEDDLAKVVGGWRGHGWHRGGGMNKHGGGGGGMRKRGGGGNRNGGGDVNITINVTLNIDNINFFPPPPGS